MATTWDNNHKWSADGWCMIHSTEAGPVYCDSTDVGPGVCDRLPLKRPAIFKEKHERVHQAH